MWKLVWKIFQETKKTKLIFLGLCRINLEVGCQNNQRTKAFRHWFLMLGNSFLQQEQLLIRSFECAILPRDVFIVNQKKCFLDNGPWKQKQDNSPKWIRTHSWPSGIKVMCKWFVIMIIATKKLDPIYGSNSFAKKNLKFKIFFKRQKTPTEELFKGGRASQWNKFKMQQQKKFHKRNFSFRKINQITKKIRTNPFTFHFILFYPMELKL